MTWAVICEEGYPRTIHRREAGARLNARGCDVVEAPEAVKDALTWRYDRTSEAWVKLDTPRPAPWAKPEKDYRGKRAEAYGKTLETDRQLEAIVEALAVLFDGKPTPPKFAALLQDIAAVKARHPKP